VEKEAQNKKEVEHKKYAQPPRHKHLIIIKTKKGRLYENNRKICP
jgi:hypothetical protein